MGATFSPFPATRRLNLISTFLRRGMAAGLIAGLLAGLFAFFVGEPLLDRAVSLEPAGHSHAEKEVFSRTTQKAGLFVVTGFAGMFSGGLFGIAFAVFRDHLSSRSDWGRSLSLAGAVFVGAVLLPFLKYPANPPAVGDASDIGTRTIAYFAMVGLSMLAVLAAWITARTLRKQGVESPIRHLTVGLGLAAVFVVLFVELPAGSDPGDFPAGLLWSFRLSSLGTQVVLWTGLGVAFGLLCERANRKAAGDRGVA